MGLEVLFKNKNIQNGIEECIEKIVQYGQKTLKVMKPEIQEFSHYNGGMIVPKSLEPYYTKGGFKPTGHSLQEVKDVWVNNKDLLRIAKVTKLDGAVQMTGETQCKKTLFKNFGTPNCYSIERIEYPSGYHTFNSNRPLRIS